jgi:hypothetical protein
MAGASQSRGLDRVSAELRAAVAQAYGAFGHHPAPTFPLDMCTVCCATPEIEQELREWPLSQLTAHHLHEYNTAAKSATRSVAETGHFLPRMFELLAAGEAIHHSIEVALRRLGDCPSDAWSAQERVAIDRFALAYFDEVLHGSLAHRWDDDPFSVLLMFEIAGVELAPLLAAWHDSDHPAAAIRYVECAYWFFMEGEVVTQAFADDRPEFKRQLQAWMLDASCKRAFAARLRDAVFVAQAASQEDLGPMPFTTAADIVLWYLDR